MLCQFSFLFLSYQIHSEPLKKNKSPHTNKKLTRSLFWECSILIGLKCWKKLSKIVRRSFRLSDFEFVMKNRVKLCIQMNKIQKNRVKFAPVCMCDDLKQELKQQAYHCIIFLVINLYSNSLSKPYLYVMNIISIFFISPL